MQPGISSIAGTGGRAGSTAFVATVVAAAAAVAEGSAPVVTPDEGSRAVLLLLSLLPLVAAVAAAATAAHTAFECRRTSWWQLRAADSLALPAGSRPHQTSMHDERAYTYEHISQVTKFTAVHVARRASAGVPQACVPVSNPQNSSSHPPWLRYSRDSRAQGTTPAPSRSFRLWPSTSAASAAAGSAGPLAAADAPRAWLRLRHSRADAAPVDEQHATTVA